MKKTMRKKMSTHLKLRIHLITDLRNILACMVTEYSSSQIVVKAYDNFCNDYLYI